MPRFGGIATFMRLPGGSTPDHLDAAVIGVPFDIGTSNRPGARFGPRGIRNESVLLRPYNMATRAAPFDSLRIDDLGDVATNPYNVADSMARIEAYYQPLVAAGLKTVSMGGDHTIVLPILRAMAGHHGPVGLVHVDAHTDINDSMFGESIAHGTPFRRAVEEGLLDCSRVAQIGVRGTGYQADDFDWSRQQGFRVVQVEECWHRSLEPLMTEVRAQLGSGPQIERVPATRADRIELYTEPYARAWGTADAEAVTDQYVQAAITARALGLGINAGHDLNLHNLGHFCRVVPDVLEVSIGHAITADALDMGWKKAVRAYLDVLEDASS